MSSRRERRPQSATDARSAFIKRILLGSGAAVATAVAALCGISASIVGAEDKSMTLAIASSAFVANGSIPSLYTCEGTDISPPLSWSGAPAGTKSFALIVDDPDAPDPAAPKMTWVHWVLYDIASTATGLPEAVKAAALPTGTREGVNDWGRSGYGGPCPPVGRHRYFHKLYALDAVLPDLKRPNKAALEQAMRGHVLAQATLIGTYQKRR
jgi:Raf kinase inhibitor-like YbhB/YbcL family protein